MPEREPERHPRLSSFCSLLVDIGIFSIVGAGAVVIITGDYTLRGIEIATERIGDVRDRFISKYFSQDNKL